MFHSKSSVQLNEKKPSKREVSLQKGAHEPFGADIHIQNGRALIIHVEETTATLAKPAYTAAFRAGLKWGDEIHLVNGMSPFSMTPTEFITALDGSSILQLEILEQPVTNRFTMPGAMSVCDYPGVVYSEGRIVEVITNSMAHKTGVQADETIISINGKSTIKWSDENIIAEINHKFYTGDEIVLETIDFASALEMIDSMLGSMSRRRISVKPWSLIDADFCVREISTRG